jgi:hypothetical protein
MPVFNFIIHKSLHSSITVFITITVIQILRLKYRDIRTSDKAVWIMNSNMTFLIILIVSLKNWYIKFNRKVNWPTVMKNCSQLWFYCFGILKYFKVNVGTLNLWFMFRVRLGFRNEKCNWLLTFPFLLLLLIEMFALLKSFLIVQLTTPKSRVGISRKSITLSESTESPFTCH